MKIGRIISLLSLSAILLASCGENSEENNEQSSEYNTISMWVQFSSEDAEGQVMQESIRAFNESQDEYTAEVQYIPRSGSGGGYEDVINAALTTDTLPDVLTVDGPNTAAYAQSEILQPVEEYLSDIDDFLPSIIEQGMYDDELYSIGYSESGVGFYYNVDMLEEAGVDTSTLPTVEEPWDWNQFNDMLEILANHYDRPILDMGFDDHSEFLLYAYAPFLWSAGADITNEAQTESIGHFNSDEAYTAFSFIRQLIENDYSTIAPVDYGFHTGEYALLMSGSWTLQELDEEYPNINYGVMPYPVSPETQELVSPTGSWAYGMSTSAENTEGAGALIDFLTQEEQLYQMSMGNTVLPARQSVVDRMVQEVGEPMQVLIEQNAASGQARPSLVNYPQISRAYQETVTEATYYDYSPDLQELLDRKAEEIEVYLQQER